MFLNKAEDTCTSYLSYSFLENNYLLFEQQYGFRYKRSTNHALIDITNTIQEACDSVQYVCKIYGDDTNLLSVDNLKKR